MECVYNTMGLCYKDNEDLKECLYAGCENECEDAEESQVRYMNSRNKGAAGERELAGKLRECGYDCHRGQQ